MDELLNTEDAIDKVASHNVTNHRYFLTYHVPVSKEEHLWQLFITLVSSF